MSCAGCEVVDLTEEKVVKKGGRPKKKRKPTSSKGQWVKEHKGVEDVITEHMAFELGLSSGEEEESSEDEDDNFEFVDPPVQPPAPVCGKRKRRQVYTGDSKKSLSRMKKAKRDCIAKVPMRPLSSYWGGKKTFSYEDRAAKIAAAFEKLENIMYAKNRTTTRSKHMQMSAILATLGYMVNDNLNKCAAADKASRGMPGNKMKRSWRCVLNWTNYFVKHGTLPPSKQGRHQKAASFLKDEDVRAKVVHWLRTTKRVKRTPHNLMRFFNECILPSYSGTLKKRKLSERTIRRWMNVCGYKYGIYKKGNSSAFSISFFFSLTSQYLQVYTSMDTKGLMSRRIVRSF